MRYNYYILFASIALVFGQIYWLEIWFHSFVMYSGSDIVTAIQEANRIILLSWVELIFVAISLLHAGLSWRGSVLQIQKNSYAKEPFVDIAISIFCLVASLAIGYMKWW